MESPSNVIFKKIYGEFSWSENGVTESRHYPNAPIIEATISLGIVTPTDLTTEDLSAMRELVDDQYSPAGEEYFYSGEVSISTPGEPPRHDDVHQHIGYSFISHDGRQIVRVRLDSFDFSVKEPYGSWKPFRDEARRLWEIFKKISGVTEISRVAVRYINRIDIPTAGLDTIRLDNYLLIYPEVPDNWPNESRTNSFFMQLQMWQADLNCMLVVNEAPGRPPDNDVASVRLDFDLFREEYDDPWQASHDVEVWEYVERLRQRKNEVFNASITDETRRLIE